MMTNQQQFVNQATMVYYRYDKDRNGVLKKKEFKKAMQGLFLYFDIFVTKMCLFQIMDDNDDEFSHSCICSTITILEMGAHKGETKHLFKMVDTDHNKVITLNGKFI